MAKFRKLAAAVDTAIGIIIGGGVGAFTSYVKSVGTEAAKKIFAKTILDKIIALGAKNATLIGISASVDFTFSIFCIGDRVAEYLDSIDSEPHNGYWDVF